MIFREELVVELAAAADDDDSAVREELVGGVPAAGGEIGGGFGPVGVGGEETNGVVAVVEATGLEEGGVGEEGAGGTPGVGKDGERMERKGREVEEDGVGGAVGGESEVGRVLPAVAGG